MLSVLTRETCCCPPPYQAMDMPFGKVIRSCRRAPWGVSSDIARDNLFSWTNREPGKPDLPRPLLCPESKGEQRCKA